MENSNGTTRKFENASKQKTRETFSVPLKIPLQTEILSQALQKYRNELQLDNGSSKTDFFLFLMRRYLIGKNIQPVKQTDATNKELLGSDAELKEQGASPAMHLDQAAQKITLDISSDEMRAFERAVCRRVEVGYSQSREHFISQMFTYMRSQFGKKHLLND